MNRELWQGTRPSLWFKVQSQRSNRLCWDFHSSWKDKGYSDVDWYCILQEIQIALDGCKECLLDGYLDEDVYATQPPGFQLSGMEEHVYKEEVYAAQHPKFLLKMVSPEVNLIIHFSLGRKVKVSLFCKYMSMKLFLVVLMSFCVRSFQDWWVRNLRWAWWVS